jgi:NADH-quinone oxidoreductase subunit M
LTLASLGQPGLGSFPGELFILAGTWRFYPVLTIVATLGIVMAAAYLLRWYQKMFTGDMGTYRVPPDLSGRESLILMVPIVLTFLMGFCPSVFIAPVQDWLKGIL